MTKPRAIISALWEKHLDVLDLFLADSEVDVVLVSAHQAFPSLAATTERHGCRLVVLESLLGPDNRAAAKSAVTVSALHAHLAQDGWAAPVGDREALTTVLRHRIVSDVPAAISLLETLAAAREQFDIALFVTSEDVLSSSKVTAAWARSWKVPSLHLAHSLALVDPYTVHADLVADTLAVYGARGAEGYLDLGIDASRIVTTGNPAWDGYAALREQRGAIREDLVRRYALDPELPIVVFGTTWAAHLSALEGGDNHRRTLATFLTAAEDAATRGVRFQAVIKDRPSNAAHGKLLVDDLLDGRDLEQTYIYATGDTQAWAVGADVLVAVESNYLVEAMLGGALPVNLAGSTAAMPPSFAADAGILEADGDDLAERLVEILTDSGLRTRLREDAARSLGQLQYGAGDGQAGRRVADLMRAMMRPATPPTRRTARSEGPAATSGRAGLLGTLRRISRRRG